MPEILIKPSGRWEGLNFKELGAYWELLFFLVWRNIRVRYSQTVIGVLWVIIQPVMTTFIFTAIFGWFAKLPSEGVPYAIFVFSGLLPWNLFANSISGASTSLVMNRNLISKVYFPRVFIPLAKVFETLIDFCISCVILVILMWFYKYLPPGSVIFFPFFVLWVVILALGVGLWLSALNVKYRDIAHGVPFLVQIWFYVSPVAYAYSIIPAKWQWLYAMNPMVGIIEGFRWALLGKGVNLETVLPISMAVSCLILFLGVIYFCNTERTFSDII
jgi:lipopolysaccharide transport system permease protein